MTVSITYNSSEHGLMIGNRLSPLVLKELIRQHNIASCRYYIFKKSEHKQIKAVCTNKQCEYVCRASRPAKSPPETLYKVTALKDHNCQLEDETTYTPPPPSSKYLASLSYIQLTGYPCSHGIAALLKLKRNIASGVDSYYYSENYKRTYGEGILPIDLSITLASVTILPPEVKTGRGRPRIRRYKPGESQKRKESS
ncbi:hypothetical protein GEMRC1_006344 [Eukaryota sp. GEM-RC1]